MSDIKLQTLSFFSYLLLTEAFTNDSQVLGFLQQQGRTRNNSDKRLLDSRNGAGETPLLRAASIGKIPTLKVNEC
jgi:hypothetical protein